jgi:hypothetical protein
MIVQSSQLGQASISEETAEDEVGDSKAATLALISSVVPYWST